MTARPDGRTMAYYREWRRRPPKRHTQHRDPDGGLYYEELMGEEGFSSDSSLLYHRGHAVGARRRAAWELPDQTTVPNEPLLPRHLRAARAVPAADVETTDVVTGRRLVLGNDDVRIS